MKIGTITFHWVTNYGAVLQAFALQQYLKTKGHETEIINYVPFNVKYRQIISNIKHADVNNLVKEYKINRFRIDNLIVSHKKYYTNSQLIKGCHNYDAYICGSDQVWNEWFTISSENKPNLSYYLNFVKNENKRVSYATSFGTTNLSLEVINLVKPELRKFNSIGVRENSGKTIVEEMGFDATVVVDPTLLLPKESYEELFENKNIKDKYQLFSYILHSNQTTASKINDYVFENYFNDNIDKKYNQEPIGIIEWLYNIKNSKFVLTNSFHGAVFSIIFRTPFMVIPVEGSKMNDRILTLLNSVGLQNRIIDVFDEKKIDRLMKECIEWEEVDNRVRNLRRSSEEYLENSLEI